MYWIFLYLADIFDGENNSRKGLKMKKGTRIRLISYGNKKKVNCLSYEL